MSDVQTRPLTKVHVARPCHYLLVKRRGQSTGIRVQEAVVEFTNQPGIRYDYIVELRIVDEDDAPRIAVMRHEPRPRAGDEIVATDVYREAARVDRAAVRAASFPVDKMGAAHVGPKWVPRFRPSDADIESAMSRNGGLRDWVAEEVGIAAKVVLTAEGQPHREAVRRALEAERRARKDDRRDVELAVVDKRIAAAREQGLLPPATTGRPRAS